MAPPPGIKSTFIIPTDLLDDIASRFLLDAPDSELGNPISLCFLTELAYWFYLDEYAEEDDSLNNLKFDPFAQQLLNRVGFKPQTGTIDDMLQGFRDFKHRVPTYGGLLLNQDLSQVLLVQTKNPSPPAQPPQPLREVLLADKELNHICLGFWHRASWGFPKGKINVDEEPHNCAIREVLEETGYDISPLIDPNVSLETSIGEQFVRLYIIPGVSTTTEFVPRTKGEIKQLKWFPISQLPSHKNDRNFNKVNGSTNMFYMVMPFVKPLREWLANRQRAAVNGTGNGAGREGRRRHRSSTTAADHNQSYSQTRHSHSPATTSDTAKRPQPTPDASRKQQSAAFSSYIQEEAAGFERLRINTDSSPRRRETSTKTKSRKSLFGEQEENPKFTFKSRGKGRGNKANRENQPAGNGNTSNTATWETKPNFRSYSWQSFHINKKEVMDAIEGVWSNSILGL